MIINSSLLINNEEKQELLYRERPEGSKLTHSITVKKHDNDTYLVTVKCAFSHNLLDDSQVTLELDGSQYTDFSNFEVIDERTFSFQVNRYKSISVGGLEFVPNRTQIVYYYRKIYPRYVKDDEPYFKVKINGNLYRAEMYNDFQFGVIGTEAKIDCINGDEFSYDNFELFEFTNHGSITLSEKLKIYYSSSYFTVPINLNYATNYDGRNEEIFRDNIVSTLMDSINYTSTKVEKAQFIPFVVNNGNYVQADKIEFNLHFRDRRRIDEDNFGTIYNELSSGWTSNEALGWNCYDFEYTDLGNSKTKESLKPQNEYYSEWMSDRLDYLGFTESDIKYQRKKLGKSFLRLCFYSTPSPLDRQLLFYTTIFTDTAELAGKYQRLKNNGASDVFAENYDSDDDRLSSRFYVTNKYNDDRSSEGFYLYFFPEELDGNEVEETDNSISNVRADYSSTIGNLSRARRNAKLLEVAKETYTVIRFNLHFLRMGSDTDKAALTHFDPYGLQITNSAAKSYSKQWIKYFLDQIFYIDDSYRNSNPFIDDISDFYTNMSVRFYKSDGTSVFAPLYPFIEDSPAGETAINGFLYDADENFCVFCHDSYIRATVELNNFHIIFRKREPNDGTNRPTKDVEMYLNIKFNISNSHTHTYEIPHNSSLSYDDIINSINIDDTPVLGVLIKENDLGTSTAKIGNLWECKSGFKYSYYTSGESITLKVLSNDYYEDNISMVDNTIPGDDETLFSTDDEDDDADKTITEPTDEELQEFFDNQNPTTKKTKKQKVLRKTIYMKVEYNHAGYGVTVPFMLPYSTDENGIKSIIHSMDDDFPTSFYETKKIGKVYKEDINKDLYFKYTMIPLVIEYRSDIDEYLYYFEFDNIDMDERKIQFNLFEPRLKGFVDLVRVENSDKDINGDD